MPTEQRNVEKEEGVGYKYRKAVIFIYRKTKAFLKKSPNYQICLKPQFYTSYPPPDYMGFNKKLL